MTDHSEQPPESGEPPGPRWQPPPGTWSDPLRRYSASVSDLGHAAPPPTSPAPPRKVGWRLPTSIAVVALIALGIFVTVLRPDAAKKDVTAAYTSTAQTVPTLLSTTAASTSGSAKPTIVDPAHSATRRPTTPAGRTATAPRGTTTVHVSAGSPSRSTATANCRPLNVFGACFLVGEQCPTADHGLTGISPGGQAMKCLPQKGNWLWQLA